MKLRDCLWNVAVVSLALGMAGCSSHAERRAGKGVVRLAPEPANVTSQLSAIVDASYADPVRCVYHWRRNNEPLRGTRGAVLDPDRFRKGDVVAVDVSVRGLAEGATRTLTAEVHVADAPPVVRDARVVVDRASGGVELQASTDCADPDGDVTTVAYRWFRNGQPIAGAADAKLSAVSFARGDRIVFEAVASDGELRSEARRSDEFVLSNRAPRFSDQPASLAAPDGAYRFQAMATDPDGDPLRFELVQGPAGMTVSASGAIDWALPAREGRQPEYPVTIRATDPNGGEATQVFSIRLTARDK
jgi:hypothetical protein